MLGLPSVGFITLVATGVALYVALGVRLSVAWRIVSGLGAFLVVATLLTLIKAIVFLVVVAGLIALAAVVGSWLADDRHEDGNRVAK